MHLVFDIFQGVGVAAAVGIRPFLPTLATGALAAGAIQINFEHTNYDFLQSAPFLAAVALAAIALALVEWRFGPDTLDRRPAQLVVGAVSIALGALLFAGSLCRGHYAVWPGYVGGVICALVGIAATRPLLRRVRARLDQATARMLPLFAATTALVLGTLSILAPPVGPIVLAVLLWLLIAGRRRGDQKYAGLRILR